MATRQRPQRRDTSRQGRVHDRIGLPFTLFRARDALDYDDAGIMHETEPAAAVPEPVGALIAEAIDQGALEATRTRLLFARPGMSLSYAWFKSGFPLPRHSHDADCLYFILAGSLRMGAEELGPGDGFFVGRNVPYAYVPGEEGVEVLEFRTADSFDIKLLANNPAWWARAIARIAEARPHWREEEQTPPSGLEMG